MGWEERRGRPYYYRARKLGGRVIKQYTGAGRSGEQATALDAAERDRRVADAARPRAALSALAPLDAATAALAGLAEALAGAALAAHGYRRHKRGEWRKGRGHHG